MEITYQVCVGFARKKPKTKQPWLVVLSFPNCGKATTRHELVRVVSISSDRSETYPTRKQLSSDWLRLYFFVTHAITFEKPMRMKKHVQKKNNFGSYWIFQQRSNLVYCAPSSNILHLRPQEFAPILRHAIVLESCFFFLIMSVSSPYSPLPTPLNGGQGLSLYRPLGSGVKRQMTF